MKTIEINVPAMLEVSKLADLPVPRIGSTYPGGSMPGRADRSLLGRLSGSCGGGPRRNDQS